ncbi:hypothetical protein KQX54_018915 [Cotesia glomerata]|uniref:Uncharacterized protein n=1 Tax=Cotesia glomerata TaxID=32391 RepID=A0AAV7HT33_COTGL|nr:hypothetical protein KQX54_018915 [Cotesia glomerata]
MDSTLPLSKLSSAPLPALNNRSSGLRVPVSCNGSRGCGRVRSLIINLGAIFNGQSQTERPMTHSLPTTWTAWVQEKNSAGVTLCRLRATEAYAERFGQPF